MSHFSKPIVSRNCRPRHRRDSKITSREYRQKQILNKGRPWLLITWRASISRKRTTETESCKKVSKIWTCIWDQILSGNKMKNAPRVKNRKSVEKSKITKSWIWTILSCYWNQRKPQFQKSKIPQNEQINLRWQEKFRPDLRSSKWKLYVNQSRNNKGKLEFKKIKLLHSNT